MGRRVTGKTGTQSRDELRDYRSDIDINDRADVVPELPNAELYTEATRRWYKTWAESPQASVFLPTDWDALHMVAPLLDAYWEAPRPAALGAIRAVTACLGATISDRLRLRLVVSDHAEEEGDIRTEGVYPPVDIRSRTRRIAGSANAA